MVQGPTQPTEEYFNRGLWGYDKTRWRKLALVWGFSDTYGEKIQNTNLSVGSNSVSGSVVPAGEVWVVSHVLIIYTGTSPTFIRGQALLGAVYVDLFRQPSPVSGQSYSRQLSISMKAGDKVLATVSGATAGDALEAWFAGYKMAVT